MQRSLVFVLAFVCATASAEIYRRIGADGHVYFSDQPGPDAERIEVTPNTAVRLPQTPVQADASGQADATGTAADITPAYSNLSIVSPASNAGVRANDGNVTQACRYLVKDFGTSKSPKSTRQRGSQYAPAALRPLRSAQSASHSSHNGSTALGCVCRTSLRAAAKTPGAYRGLSASGFALPWRTAGAYR